MNHEWDEFAKSLVEESVPRRESLRRLGLVLTGAVLGPLGMQTASAGRRDPCKTFCRCRNKSQQRACLAACNACNGDTSRLCGACGSYVCCGNGTACCGDYCADLEGDPYNCGACGHVCDQPGQYEYGACLFGECWYQCVEGAVDCDGICTFPGWDPYNCGACGNVCPESAPYCNQGECADCLPGTALCGGQCVDLFSDASNCGGCGQACPTGHVCSGGVCCNPTISDCSGGSDPCIFPFILCGGACVDPTSDPFNCGACFQQCAPNEVCAGGFCQGFGGDGGW